MEIVRTTVKKQNFRNNGYTTTIEFNGKEVYVENEEYRYTKLENGGRIVESTTNINSPHGFVLIRPYFKEKYSMYDSHNRLIDSRKERSDGKMEQALYVYNDTEKRKVEIFKSISDDLIKVVQRTERNKIGQVETDVEISEKFAIKNPFPECYNLFELLDREDDLWGEPIEITKKYNENYTSFRESNGIVDTNIITEIDNNKDGTSVVTTTLNNYDIVILDKYDCYDNLIERWFNNCMVFCKRFNDDGKINYLRVSYNDKIVDHTWIYHDKNEEGYYVAEELVRTICSNPNFSNGSNVILPSLAITYYSTDKDFTNIVRINDSEGYSMETTEIVKYGISGLRRKYIDNTGFVYRIEEETEVENLKNIDNSIICSDIVSRYSTEDFIKDARSGNSRRYRSEKFYVMDEEDGSHTNINVITETGIYPDTLEQNKFKRYNLIHPGRIPEADKFPSINFDIYTGN